MQLHDKIYVAGHGGLLGSALVRRLRQAGYDNLLLRTHAELDLTEADAVRSFFAENRPQHVFLAAAKVGGIVANDSFPAGFLFENLRIQANVIDECRRGGAERLLFMGSSCIYPKLAPQPLREEYFMTGPLEFTNRAYAAAKIAGIEMCWACNRQYGTHFLAAMPTNLYGPGDRYHPNYSHLVPAMIRKMQEARISGAPAVTIWGSGTPRREFLYSDDAADACIFLLNLPAQSFAQLAGPESAPLVNVGWGRDMTVKELAELAAETVGIGPTLVFDSAKPDGTPQKLLDTGRLTALGWKPRIGLREGLQRTYADFCSGIDAGEANQSEPARPEAAKSVSQCAS
jgi:GDP-L-fucose synthase